jgi:energy-coupling factor transport system permease protein
MNQLHPAHRLGCWLLVVAAIQCLQGVPLLLVLAATPLLGRTNLARWLRLLRRARWLLLTLLLVVAWGVAGEPLWEFASLPAPTYEGIREASTQLGRLVLVLAAVAVLLETTPIDRLMSGVHVLLRPLRVFGLEVDRAVVRLSLALHYAEQMPAAADWKEMLSPTEPTGPQVVHLALPSPQLRDWLTLLAAMLLPIGACLA